MLIRTLCRGCLGSGTQIQVLPYAPRHQPPAQTLVPRPCPHCAGNGHHHLAATHRPTPSGNGI